MMSWCGTNPKSKAVAPGIARDSESLRSPISVDGHLSAWAMAQESACV